MQHGGQPSLKVFLVGENASSLLYVKNKRKACERVGIHMELIHLPHNTPENELLAEITHANDNISVHGILVQLPLPAHIDTQKVIETINPKKDVDGFHSINIGRAQSDDARAFYPCTALGVWEMMQYYNLNPRGKNIVLLGYGRAAGRSIANLLLAQHCTLTVCNSETPEITMYTKNADILISATGVPGLIGADMVKEGAALIDVGITRMQDGSLCGDSDPSVDKKLAYKSPVPGGVGPMTVHMLLWNVYKAYIKE